MGMLDYLFENPDLKCAAGIAATPLLGPLSVLACEEAIESRIAPKPTSNFCEASVSPEMCEAGSYVGKQILKTLRIFQDAPKSIDDARRLLQELTRGLLITTPFFPVVVGLERFGYPMLPELPSDETISKLGSFAADVAMSSALFGVATLGGKLVAKGVRKAVVGVDTQSTFKKRLESLVGPSASLFFNPLF